MLAGLEVVHFLIGFIDQVVHGGDVRLKAGAADADLDLIGLAGGGVGGVQLSLDGDDQGAHLHAVAAAGDAEFIAAVARQHANPSLRTLQRLAAGMGMKVKIEFVPASAK